MFGPVNGHRHDSTVLRRSRILAILHDICRAEWGFGKIVNLWPYLDYRKKHKVLQAPVGRLFAVGNVLGTH